MITSLDCYVDYKDCDIEWILLSTKGAVSERKLRVQVSTHSSLSQIVR